MKSGEKVFVDGVEFTLWDRAPSRIAPSLYDPWWVTRDGLHGPEMWAIGRERRHGRFSREWRVIGRFTWKGTPIHR